MPHVILTENNKKTVCGSPPIEKCSVVYNHKNHIDTGFVTADKRKSGQTNQGGIKFFTLLEDVF